MTTVLAVNASQAQATAGNGFHTTPTGVLEGLEEHQVSQRDLFINAPEPFNPEDPNHYHLGAGARSSVLLEQENVSCLAYATSEGHNTITKALRSGAISPPRGGATYGDAGYYDPRRTDGSTINVFTGEATVLGDGSGTVQALDGAMADNWMTAPVTLYRGLAVEPEADFSPGARWYEPGYTSVTISPDTAIEFAKFQAGLPNNVSDDVPEAAGGLLPIFMQVEVPPGTQFMPGMESVDELVLERGATFEVLENRGDTIIVRFGRFDNTEPPVLEESA